MKTGVAQRRENGLGGHGAGGLCHFDILHAGQMWVAAAALYEDAPRAVIAQTIGLGGDPARRIEHNARGLGSSRPCLRPPRRQVGIIGEYRSDTDNHGIGQRPQAVKVDNGRVAVDVVGMTRCRRDAPVEGLADLSDYESLVLRPLNERRVERQKCVSGKVFSRSWLAATIIGSGQYCRPLRSLPVPVHNGLHDRFFA